VSLTLEGIFRNIGEVFIFYGFPVRDQYPMAVVFAPGYIDQITLSDNRSGDRCASSVDLLLAVIAEPVFVNYN
jgi:hypothetical protein